MHECECGHGYNVHWFDGKLFPCSQCDCKDYSRNPHGWFAKLFDFVLGKFDE